MSRDLRCKGANTSFSSHSENILNHFHLAEFHAYYFNVILRVFYTATLGGHMYFLTFSWLNLTFCNSETISCHRVYLSLSEQDETLFWHINILNCVLINLIKKISLSKWHWFCIVTIQTPSKLCGQDIESELRLLSKSYAMEKNITKYFSIKNIIFKIVNIKLLVKWRSQC